MTRAYIKKCMWDSAPHRNDMDFPQEREQQNVLSRACMHARKIPKSLHSLSKAV